LRGVAVMLRKESGDLGDLAFSIRLRKIMDENSLSEDNMESAIIKLAVYYSEIVSLTIELRNGNRNLDELRDEVITSKCLLKHL
jgi:hypothetical protein